MIRALITGKLHDTPQARTSANGNTFAIAKVKADDKGGAWVWVSVIAFGAESERLLELKAGDAVAIGGRAELNVWQDRDGNHHPGLSLVADEVATLRGKPKARNEGEPRNPSQPPRRRDRARQPEVAGDGIPFDDVGDWQP
jgi:single-stranded DNA-binding protein